MPGWLDYDGDGYPDIDDAGRSAYDAVFGEGGYVDRVTYDADEIRQDARDLLSTGSENVRSGATQAALAAGVGLSTGPVLVGLGALTAAGVAYATSDYWLPFARKLLRGF